MKRGRRVGLLLTFGLWPLLAKDDSSSDNGVVDGNVNRNDVQASMTVNGTSIDDENDNVIIAPPPLFRRRRPLTTRTTPLNVPNYNPNNVVMATATADYDYFSSVFEEEEEEQQQQVVVDDGISSSSDMTTTTASSKQEERIRKQQQQDADEVMTANDINIKRRQSSSSSDEDEKSIVRPIIKRKETVTTDENPTLSLSNDDDTTKEVRTTTTTIQQNKKEMEETNVSTTTTTSREEEEEETISNNETDDSSSSPRNDDEIPVIDSYDTTTTQQQNDDDDATTMSSSNESLDAVSSSSDDDNNSDAVEKKKEMSSSSSSPPNNEKNQTQSNNVKVKEKSDDDNNDVTTSESSSDDGTPSLDNDVEPTKNDEEATRVDVNDDDDEDGTTTDRVVLVDYASKSAGALILEKSAAMKGTSNLLVADNDKYAIVPCSDERKFVVIGLSEDILVKQVRLANYERYSSHVRDFQLLGSQTMGEWVDLGTYTAEKPGGNEEQTFDLREPSWARYLKFRFLSHYGTEHYCTYSQIKVHGSTMLQGFHEQWDSQETLEENVDDASHDASVAEETDSTGKTEGQMEPTGEDVASIGTKEEDEGATDAESPKVPKEKEIGGRIFQDGSGGPADVAREDYPKPSADAEKVGITPGVVPVDDSAVNSRSENKIGSQPDVKDADRTGTVQMNVLSRTDSNVEGVAESEADSDEMSSNSSVKGEPSSTLSCASIVTSSRDALNAPCTGSTQQLDTSAIKPPSEKTIRTVVSSVVETLVAAEASMSIMDAESVSDEVKEIQEKLKTLGTGMPKIGADAEMERVDLDSETVEALPIDQPEGTTVSASPTDETESVDRGKPVTAGSEATSEAKSPENTADTESSPNSSAATQTETDRPAHREIKGKGVEHLDVSEKSTQDDLDPALSKIIERFPSATCMKGLGYQDFKTKLVAGRKDRASTHGGNPSGTAGRMEPIFKKLTDEIKGLQISQSVQDQYLKALISCYQQVMLEMAETLSDVETRQEQRLLDLEEAMAAMRSNKASKLLAALVTMPSTCYLGAKLLYEALLTGWAAVLASSHIDETTLFVVLGVCFLGLLAFLYHFFASNRKKMEPRRTVQDEARLTFDKQSRIIDKAPTTDFMSSPEQSESGSESSEPYMISAVATLPSQKRPNVQKEPVLVPIE